MVKKCPKGMRPVETGEVHRWFKVNDGIEKDKNKNIELNGITSLNTKNKALKKYTIEPHAPR